VGPEGLTLSCGFLLGNEALTLSEHGGVRAHSSGDLGIGQTNVLRFVFHVETGGSRRVKSKSERKVLLWVRSPRRSGMKIRDQRE
jgi:hypothetical protein